MSDKKEVEVKTDYYGIHELQYQQLRKIGKCGWMDSGYKEEQFKRIISFIEKYTTKKSFEYWSLVVEMLNYR